MGCGCNQKQRQYVVTTKEGRKFLVATRYEALQLVRENPGATWAEKRD